ERGRGRDPLVEHAALPVPAGSLVVQREREALARLRVDALDVVKQPAGMLHRGGALVQPSRVLLLECGENLRVDNSRGTSHGLCQRTTSKALAPAPPP